MTILTLGTGVPVSRLCQIFGAVHWIQHRIFWKPINLLSVVDGRILDSVQNILETY